MGAESPFRSGVLWNCLCSQENTKALLATPGSMVPGQFPLSRAAFLFFHSSYPHSRGQMESVPRTLIYYIQSFASAKCCWSENVVVAGLWLDPPAVLQGKLLRPLTGQLLHLRFWTEHISYLQHGPSSELELAIGSGSRS